MATYSLLANIASSYFCLSGNTLYYFQVFQGLIYSEFSVRADC